MCYTFFAPDSVLCFLSASKPSTLPSGMPFICSTFFLVLNCNSTLSWSCAFFHSSQKQWIFILCTVCSSVSRRRISILLLPICYSTPLLTVWLSLWDSFVHSCLNSFKKILIELLLCTNIFLSSGDTKDLTWLNHPLFIAAVITTSISLSIIQRTFWHLVYNPTLHLILV